MFDINDTHVKHVIKKTNKIFEVVRNIDIKISNFRLSLKDLLKRVVDYHSAKSEPYP